MHSQHSLFPPFSSSKQTNGVFELKVTNDAKEEALWTIDMKITGTIYKGAAKPKADVTISLTDETLAELATGKVRSYFRLAIRILRISKMNGQKAFMTGKLKTKGNLMLATKLDGLFKVTILSSLANNLPAYRYALFRLQVEKQSSNFVVSSVGNIDIDTQSVTTRTSFHYERNV